MALPILDGNQTAATLSTIITGGAHIPAHTVVSLGSQAISDITSGVSGSVVSISNFPSTQTIAGTVTVSNATAASAVFVKICGEMDGAGTNEPREILTDNSGMLYVRLAPNNAKTADPVIYDPVAGTAYINVRQEAGTSITVGNSVTIGSLPAISGTVTIGNNNYNFKSIVTNDGSTQIIVPQSGTYRIFTPLGATKNLNNIFGSNPSWLTAFADNVVVVSDSGTQVSYYSDGSQWTLDDFTTPAGTITLDGSLFIFSISAESIVVLQNGFSATQLDSPVVNDGAVRAQLYASTVTVGSMPSGSLTTRFGSVATANLAFITSAVTNTSRKYLLAQNISAGTVTIGIGFSPTTTQGIQLTAGGGLTFDAFCPTGAVYWLGAVTGAAFTILEG